MAVVEDNERRSPDPAESNGEETALQDIEGMVDKKLEEFDTPYVSSVETLPKMAAFHPSFAKVEGYHEHLLDVAARTLETSNYHDSFTDCLLENIKDRRTIKYPEAQVVGVVGDSGVGLIILGKSSLINAILDTPDLALTGATGAACTCVITEFRQALPAQTTAFNAEIVLFDQERVKSMLKAHLQDYWHGNMEDKEEFDPDALEAARIQSDTAIEVFRTLFADRYWFQDEARMHTYLGAMSSPSDTAILARLLHWTEELVHTCGATNRSICRSAETASNLSERIEPFVKVGVNSELINSPSVWPIVKVVRIGLKAPLLKAGLIVADLPGLSDTNRTRTRITNEYIHSCDFLCLVAPIARVQTDNLVDKRIYDYRQKFGTKVALDVPSNAKPQDFSAKPQASWEHQQLSRTYEDMGRRKTELSIKKRTANGKEKATLSQELNDISLRRKICHTFLKESVVTMRNRKVESVMATKYCKTDTASESLKVWCVSSTDYQVNTRGYDDEQIPMSVNATGIPRLRAFLLRMPAEQKLEVLKMYSQAHLPSLIRSIDMWTVQSNDIRRNELREVAAKPRKEIRWPTYRAWCNHRGHHSTRKYPNWDWNLEFLQPVLKDVQTPWQTFDKSCDDASQHCFVALAKLLDGIREGLSSMDDVTVVPAESFLKSLAPKKLQLRGEIRVFFTKIQKFGRLNVVTSDTDASYLVQALDPVYESCTREKGRHAHSIHRPRASGNVNQRALGSGSHGRRVAMLQNAMHQGKPFAKMELGIKSVMESDLDERIRKLIKEVQAIFDSVLLDFDSMFVVRERPNANRDNLRNAVKDFVAKADATLNGPMEQELAKAIKDSD
ncbi:MAG: hypothetical protein Q9170_006308 [Blastenia crenularia]